MAVDQEVAVLVKTPEFDSRVVRVPVDSVQADGKALQSRLEAVVQLGPGSVESLSFRGQPLAAGDGLVRAGVSVWTGGAGADEAVYPNAWFATALSKAHQKPLDPSWPLLCHADQAASLRWVAAALLALVVTSWA